MTRERCSNGPPKSFCRGHIAQSAQQRVWKSGDIPPSQKLMAWRRTPASLGQELCRALQFFCVTPRKSRWDVEDTTSCKRSYGLPVPFKNKNYSVGAVRTYVLTGTYYLSLRATSCWEYSQSWRKAISHRNGQLVKPVPLSSSLTRPATKLLSPVRLALVSARLTHKRYLNSRSLLIWHSWDWQNIA